MKADKNAFPYELGDGTVYTGLTTRDYIAIQVLVGLNANINLTPCSYEDMADFAYKQADAMIKRSEE